MKPYDFYLFVARVNEANLQDYDRYNMDEQTHTSLFFTELGITDVEYLEEEKAYNYGIDLLWPDFRYEFPLSELFKFSLLKDEDLPMVEQFCREKGIVPNSYIIIYRKGLTLTDDITLSFPDIHFVGKFTMSEEDLESEKLANPHLF